ncbi:hypothetical protein CFE70_005772 [Pyrenophora teres f. teres 0-1]
MSIENLLPLEFTGKLVGFDDYVNGSDPAEGNVKLPKILLNGNNICMMVPGGDGTTVLEDDVPDDARGARRALSGSYSARPRNGKGDGDGDGGGSAGAYEATTLHISRRGIPSSCHLLLGFAPPTRTPLPPATGCCGASRIEPQELRCLFPSNAFSRPLAGSVGLNSLRAAAINGFSMTTAARAQLDVIGGGNNSINGR